MIGRLFKSFLVFFSDFKVDVCLLISIREGARGLRKVTNVQNGRVATVLNSTYYHKTDQKRYLHA